jgi:CRISPR-associated protein Cas1
MNSQWSLSSGTADALAVLSGTPHPAAGPPPRWQKIDDESRGRSGEANARFLHVAEQGAVVRRAGQRIVITKHDKTLLQIPVIKLQGVLAYGNVQISTQCLRALLAEGVWVSLFSRTGADRGRLQPPVERGGLLRLRQWERTRDPEFALTFSRALVRGKTLGQIEVAKAFSKNYLADTLSNDYDVLRHAIDRTAAASDLDQLRGIEGAAARAYFSMFARFNRSDLPFEGRVKRGAADPLNCLLNFGYTLLTRELDGLLEAAGLDPTVGCYHAPGEDRPALACDWVEEFRHVIIDRIVLTLVNLKSIQAADFEVHAEKGGLRMKPDALRRFIAAYEAALNGGWRESFLDRLGAILDALRDGVPYRSHLEA